MKTEIAQRIVKNSNIVQRKTGLLVTTYELTPLGEILNRITFGRYRRAIQIADTQSNTLIQTISQLQNPFLNPFLTRKPLIVPWTSQNTADQTQQTQEPIAKQTELPRIGTYRPPQPVRRPTSDEVYAAMINRDIRENGREVHTPVETYTGYNAPGDTPSPLPDADRHPHVPYNNPLNLIPIVKTTLPRIPNTNVLRPFKWGKPGGR